MSVTQIYDNKYHSNAHTTFVFDNIPHFPNLRLDKVGAYLNSTTYNAGTDTAVHYLPLVGSASLIKNLWIAFNGKPVLQSLGAQDYMLFQNAFRENGTNSSFHSHMTGCGFGWYQNPFTRGIGSNLVNEIAPGDRFDTLGWVTNDTTTTYLTRLPLKDLMACLNGTMTDATGKKIANVLRFDTPGVWELHIDWLQSTDIAATSLFYQPFTGTVDLSDGWSIAVPILIADVIRDTTMISRLPKQWIYQYQEVLTDRGYLPLNESLNKVEFKGIENRTITKWALGFRTVADAYRPYSFTDLYNPRLQIQNGSSAAGGGQLFPNGGLRNDYALKTAYFVNAWNGGKNSCNLNPAMIAPSLASTITEYGIDEGLAQATLNQMGYYGGYLNAVARQFYLLFQRDEDGTGDPVASNQALTANLTCLTLKQMTGNALAPSKNNLITVDYI